MVSGNGFMVIIVFVSVMVLSMLIYILYSLYEITDELKKSNGQQIEKNAAIKRFLLSWVVALVISCGVCMFVMLW